MLVNVPISRVCCLPRNAEGCRQWYKFDVSVNMFDTVPPPRNAEGGRQWYKFDDYDVSECRMEDDEEMKTQCFGGEYVGEVRRC